MKVLITGANGFLGFYLVDLLLNKEYDVIATGKGENRLSFTGHPKFHYASMDFTDPFAVHDVFEKFQPQIVIHAGAMTRVDECELNQWESYRVNVEGTVNLMMNAEEQECFFLFLSTDFVFDGEKGMYAEDDPPNPVNYYGKTKWQAEEAVHEYKFDWAIARTVLVYGLPVTGGINILTVVKDKLEKGEEYKLVNDQFRTPTFVKDLANGIVAIVEKKAKGIFHLSGKDMLTPFEMGVKLARHLNLDSSHLIKATADNFTQPAKRPPRTGFSIEKARRELGYDPISFDAGLQMSFKK